MPQSETVEAYDGTQVEVTPIKPLESGGSRVELDAVGGGRWRVDVSPTGETTVVTSWNASGDLADLPLPDWADPLLAQLRNG